MLANGPVSLRFTLEAVNAGLEMPFDEAQHLEATLFGLICTTEDMKEGTKAFLEKRPAEVPGQVKHASRARRLGRQRRPGRRPARSRLQRSGRRRAASTARMAALREAGVARGAACTVVEVPGRLRAAAGRAAAAADRGASTPWSRWAP